MDGTLIGTTRPSQSVDEGVLYTPQESRSCASLSVAQSTEAAKYTNFISAER